MPTSGGFNAIIMKIELNRAVVFSLIFRSWQASAAVITIPLVVLFLSPEMRGTYYTFVNLAALQSFLELGFGIVITITASHEWKSLRLSPNNEILGDETARDRLITLGRLVMKYFGYATIIYVIVIAAAGYLIIRQEMAGDRSWVAPWLCYVLVSAGLFCIAPFLGILEGCNQVASAARFRLSQSIVSSAVLWTSIASGIGLWSLVAAGCAALLVAALYMLVIKRGFFLSFLERPEGVSMSWRRDLLPMQWRLAMQGMFTYLSFPLYTVLTFHYLGAVEAGRMGIALQIIGGIQTVGLVFLSARVPEFAILAASGQRETLRRRCTRATFHSMAAIAGMGLTALLALYALQWLRVPQVHRMLDVGAFGVFVIGITLTALIQGIALFLRAYKMELLTPAGVVGGLCYGASAWLVCQSYGSIGIALSHALVTAFVILPISVYIAKNSLVRI